MRHSWISIFCPFDDLTNMPSSFSSSSPPSPPVAPDATGSLPSRYFVAMASRNVTLGRILCGRTKDPGVAPSSDDAVHSKYRLPPWDPSCLPLVGSSHSTPIQMPSCASTGPTYRTTALAPSVVSMRHPTSAYGGTTIVLVFRSPSAWSNPRARVCGRADRGTLVNF